MQGCRRTTAPSTRTTKSTNWSPGPRGSGTRSIGSTATASPARRAPRTDRHSPRPLRDAHERRYDVLLCWALDRLSRGGIGATAAILARLKGAGVGLKSYKESWLDTSSPAIGELLTAVFAWVARQEADRIRERVRAGLDR